MPVAILFTTGINVCVGVGITTTNTQHTHTQHTLVAHTQHTLGGNKFPPFSETKRGAARGTVDERGCRTGDGRRKGVPHGGR